MAMLNTIITTYFLPIRIYATFSAPGANHFKPEFAMHQQRAYIAS